MNAITELSELRFFAEVVEHGSDTAAGRSLGLGTSKR
ncbi:DNA-binding transcriptional LysR family regulator [Paraburkholderia sp. GAS448]